MFKLLHNWMNFFLSLRTFYFIHYNPAQLLNHILSQAHAKFISQQEIKWSWYWKEGH